MPAQATLPAADKTDDVGVPEVGQIRLFDVQLPLDLLSRLSGRLVSRRVREAVWEGVASEKAAGMAPRQNTPRIS